MSGSLQSSSPLFNHTAPEHIYVFGDLQGCCDQFDLLHQKIVLQDSQALLFMAGDLVNRGPQSLTTLRRLMALGDKANSVLGNHDLHLLALAYCGNSPNQPNKNNPYLQPILNAPDCEKILTWLRHRPLAALVQNHLIVHAGVLPSWTVADTLQYAKEVEAVLQGAHFVDFLAQLYGNHPSRWSPTLQGVDRWRCIVNVLTRLRFCNDQDEMELDSKEGVENTPNGFMPWFELPRQTQQTPIIFGHWSALGLQRKNNVTGLDTGCVWGGKLTAMRLSDSALFEVACPEFQKIG